MLYAMPGESGSKITFKSRYENFIGGEWVAPAQGRYFENVSPVTGKAFCEVPRSSAEDIEKALDAAHAAKAGWGRMAAAERASILNKIADRMEENLEMLAVAETWDNGKPVREELAADVPLAVDHFRYFAGCIRAEEGTISEIDDDTVAYHFRLVSRICGFPVARVGRQGHDTRRFQRHGRCENRRIFWRSISPWC